MRFFDHRFLISGHVTVLVLAALAAWWLSGYDSKLTGWNKTRDFTRRAIRCGLGLFLLTLLLALPSSVLSMPFVLLISGMQTIIWCGCVVELFARWFHRLVDPDDHRPFDPDKHLRDLDMIASLVKNGQKEAAIQLCRVLKESGDVNVLTAETLLEHLGVKADGDQKPRPLVDAYRLRERGQFAEAERILKSLLAENPANVDAAMMLMRLYAEDLRRPDRALTTLRSLERQAHVSAAYIEYAHRSIAEWSGEKPGLESVPAQPESIEDLLAHGYLGTVIEILEQKIKEQPGDFDLRIKYAEVYGLHCGNSHRAEKIVRQIEAHPDFTPQQIQAAKTKLNEWKKSRVHRNPPS